jgi:tetratricopeptide (TPR) repeat protein
LPAYAQDVRLRMSRFDVSLRAENEAGMLRTLDEIKKLEGGDGLYAAYGLAVHHLWKARTRPGEGKWLDDAAAILDRLEQKRPDWTAVMLARAEIEELRGNVDRALNHYRQALSRGERNPRAVRQYGQLLLKCKRWDEVDELARRFDAAGDVSAELRRMAAFASVRAGNLDHARVLVEPAAGADAKDFRDVLWYGQVLARSGKYADAERAFKRAAQMAGEEPDPWVALARFHGARGQKDRAEKVIQDALAKLPDARRSLTVAQCYDVLNDAKKAGQYYQQALADRPGDLEVCRAAAGFYLRVQDAAKAEPCLRKLIDREVPATPQDVAWARHKLAVTIALRGDYRRYGEALGLVGLALDKNGNPAEQRAEGTPVAEEVAARARVLATQGRAPFRARAIALLEGLNKRDALLPEDRFLLAQLYESNGPDPVWWVKAGEQMALLDKQLGDDAGFLAQCANWRIRHKEYPEARLLIDRLKKLESDRKLPAGTLGSVELTVNLLEANRSGDEALTLLRDYVANGAKERDPERIFFQIGALQRRQRMADALDCCEKAWKTCPPEPCGGASLSTLKVGRPTAEQYRRVENWLRAALAKKSSSPVLALQLADLYDMQSKLDQAEALYRDVLKRDPDNPVALNNLAWHLAQRPGRGAEALPLINRAIEILGPQVELLDTRAVVYRNLGRTEEAIADLERVARDDPSASRQFRLAQAHHLARNSQAALRALEQAIRDGLDPARLPPAERKSFDKMRAELPQR